MKRVLAMPSWLIVNLFSSWKVWVPLKEHTIGKSTEAKFFDFVFWATQVWIHLIIVLQVIES